MATFRVRKERVLGQWFTVTAKDKKEAKLKVEAGKGAKLAEKSLEEFVRDIPVGFWKCEEVE